MYGERLKLVMQNLHRPFQKEKGKENVFEAARKCQATIIAKSITAVKSHGIHHVHALASRSLPGRFQSKQDLHMARHTHIFTAEDSWSLPPST